MLSIIKAELKAIRDKHAGPRLTELVPEEGEISIEDLIANEGCIITVTHKGLIKRTAVSAYRSQKRGGKGVRGASLRAGAVVTRYERVRIRQLRQQQQRQHQPDESMVPHHARIISGAALRRTVECA